MINRDNPAPQWRQRTSVRTMKKPRSSCSATCSALAGAQKLGFAEADPFLDVSGHDAAHKLAILARFAFGGKVKFKDIYCEGITEISSDDIAFAKEFGYTIKLLAIAKRSGEGMEARVQPTLLPNSHILATVNGSFNAILMRGDEVGDVLFYGRGAGPHPTASAVIANFWRSGGSDRNASTIALVAWAVICSPPARP
jgi:homoserine dehydrogenase